MREKNDKAALRDWYSQNAGQLRAETRKLKDKGRMYIMMELATFGFAVLAFVFYCTGGLAPLLLAITLVMLGAYVAVRKVDARNDERIENLVRLRIVYEREMSYLDGDFSCFDDGARYADPQHAFTYDMDVFGHDSLFNRIDRTVTTGGSDCLALLLGSLCQDKDEVARRREAIAELSEMETWRNSFIAQGQCLAPDMKPTSEKIDSAAILRVVGRVGKMKIAPFAMRPWALAMAYALIAGFFATVALTIFTPLPSSLAVAWGLVQLGIAIGIMAKHIRNIAKVVGGLHKQLQTYIRLIGDVQGADFVCVELRRLQGAMLEGGEDALMSFARLSDILKRLDSRGNVIGLILFNMLFLSDFFLVRRFLKWQKAYIGKIADWVDAVSRMDAYASMATMRYNEPQAVDAEVCDADGVVYEARGLYHPFLGAKAVRNDFSLADGNYYIITGANMAGKSTFLRSVGINYILAMNGMPVFADSLRVSVFRLFSSMRTTDDLSRGISYFNAELLRLGQLIESCRQGGHTLIILDEILKGTNSLDKLNGSRLFLRAIAHLPVTGIIATHDLELSRMEEEDPERFHNWCFEIELSDDVKYTYRITPGVARNQNATFLLKRIIADIG